MNSKILVSALFLSQSLTAGVALASQTDEATLSTVEAEESSLFSQIKEKTSMSYAAWSSPTSENISIGGFPQLSYKGDLVSSNVRVYLNANLMSASSYDPGLSLGDTRIGAQRSFSPTSNLSLFVNATAFLPSSETSRSMRRVFSPGSYQLLSYDLGNGLSVGNETDVRGHFFSGRNTAGKTAKDLTMGIAPHISYKASDLFSTTLKYQTGFAHERATSISDTTYNGYNLRLDGTVSAHRLITLNPFISMKPSNSFETTVGIEAWGTIF
jgi:hypothetical protein